MGTPNPGTCLSASSPCTTNDQGMGSQDHFRMQGQKNKRRPRKDKRLLPGPDSSHSEHTDAVLKSVAWNCINVPRRTRATQLAKLPELVGAGSQSCELMSIKTFVMALGFQANKCRLPLGGVWELARYQLATGWRSRQTVCLG